MLQTARNIAIILALAAGVDFLPGGGAAAATVLSALMLIFLAAIAWLLYRVYREQQLTLATLTDARKAGLFGAVGAMALLVVAARVGGHLVGQLAGAVGRVVVHHENLDPRILLQDLRDDERKVRQLVVGRDDDCDSLHRSSPGVHGLAA